MESLSTYRDAAEELAVRKALSEADTVQEASDLLDVTRRTVRNKIDKYGIRYSRNLGFSGPVRPTEGAGLLGELL